MEENYSLYIDKYISFVDEISSRYHYDENIKHLLYVIIPAFVIKYGIKNEKTVLNCFSSTIIYKDNTLNKSNTYGFFDRNIYYDGEYKIKKYIVIKNNQYSSYAELLDTFVHEFNHSINSINNEIKYDESYIYLRTGLSYVKYDKSTIKPVDRDNYFVLEEVINTKQSEDILTIISNLNKYNINNNEINSLIFSINSELKSSRYVSQAYSLQKYICSDLIKNKTFISTLGSLRFNGEVDDISYWFDNITGNKGDYVKINDLLKMIYECEKQFSNKKLNNKIIIYKLRKYNNSISDIITQFDNNCVYRN